MIEDMSPELRELFLTYSLRSAISKKNKDLIEFLMNKDIPNENALFEALNTRNLDIVNEVLKYRSDPLFINKKSAHGTALYIAAKMNNLKIVQRLLSIPGIDPNLYQEDDRTPLIASIVNFNLDMLNALLDFYGDKIQLQTCQLNKALQMQFNILSNKRFSSYGSLNSQSEYAKMKTQSLSILKRILQIKNIDPNLHEGEHTLLSYACEENEIGIVQMLLETDGIDVNVYAPKTGNTPLIISILKNNLEIAEILIKDKRTNINARNYENNTALTIAVMQNQENIVSLLIKNDKFDATESNINYSFLKSKGSISKLLCSLNLMDVNYKLSFFNESIINDYIGNNSSGFCPTNREYVYIGRIIYITPLFDAIKSKDIEKINFIIHHPSFDKIKSQLIQCIFYSAFLKDIDILKILLKLVDDDVNICNDYEMNLLDAALLKSSIEIIDFILKSDKFVYENKKILKSFCYSLYNIEYTKIILDFDLRRNHFIDLKKPINDDSRNIFTLDNKRFTKEMIELFMNYGADINMPDGNGVFPLEYAILSKNYELVLFILNSEKVDLKKKIPANSLVKADYVNYEKKINFKYTTYFHLLALINNIDIIKMFIDKKYLDMNAQDDQGNTPLKYFTIYGNTKVYQLLLQLSEQNLNTETHRTTESNENEEKNLTGSKENSKASFFFTFGTGTGRSLGFGQGTGTGFSFGQATRARSGFSFATGTGAFRTIESNENKENNLTDPKENSISINKGELSFGTGTGTFRTISSNENKENNLTDPKENSNSINKGEFSFGTGTFRTISSNENKENNLTDSKENSNSINKGELSFGQGTGARSGFSFGTGTGTFRTISSNENKENNLTDSKENSNASFGSCSSFEANAGKSNLSTKSVSSISTQNCNLKESSSQESSKNNEMINKSGIAQKSSSNKESFELKAKKQQQEIISNLNSKKEVEFKSAFSNTSKQEEEIASTSNKEDPKPTLEQAIENAVSESLKDAPKAKIKSIAKSVYNETSRKIKSLARGDYNNDDNDVFNPREINRNPMRIRRPIDYEDEMMQMQWQHLMQVNYANQYRYNIQMQQMQQLQALQMMESEERTKKKKRRTKSKK